MAGTLRGQLGVKSSPLCPTSSKLTTQYLVLDHMNNHYKKLSNVKPSIDNTPPKSIERSQKIRDRNQRKGGSRSSSRSSLRPDSRNTFRPNSQLNHSEIFDETYWNKAEDEEDINVLNIMKDVLKRPSGEQGDHSFAERGRNGGLETTMRWPPKDAYDSQQRHSMTQRPISARSATSVNGLMASQLTTKKSTGDVLEKRSHVFTEPDKPFTPRTLKSTRSSRLAEYKYYTPPKKQTLKKTSKVGEDDVDGPAEVNNSGYQSKKQQPSLANGQLDVTQGSMFETLQTRDLSRGKHDKNHTIPPLDISVDKDHMNWLQEQATKAQIRVESGRSQKPSSNDDRSSAQMNRANWLNKSRTKDNEDPKYVEFVKNVTQDVLDRGIFTNRVLMQAFENHIRNNKGKLDEDKMRSTLAKLRDQLGIPSDLEAESDNNNMGHSSRHTKSKERNYRGSAKGLGSTFSYPENSTADLHSSHYNGLERTETSAWLSEDGGTLQSRALVETQNYESDILSTTGAKEGVESTRSYTLKEDQDELSVTQALETYHFNIAEQDKEENHLAGEKGYESSALSYNSRAPSDGSLTDTSSRPTPREKRRKRRQQTQENMTGVPNGDNDEQISHGSVSDRRSKHASGETENQMSARSEISMAKGGMSGDDTPATYDISRKENENSFQVQEGNQNSNLSKGRLRRHQQANRNVTPHSPRSEQSSKLSEEDTDKSQTKAGISHVNGGHRADIPSKRERRRRKTKDDGEQSESGISDHRSQTPTQFDFKKTMDGRSELGPPGESFFSNTSTVEKSMSKVNVSADILRVQQSETDSHVDTDKTDERKAQSSSPDKNDDRYSDDYEEDYADDEETLTHRTSDEDF